MLHKEKTNSTQIMLPVFHLLRKLKIIPVFQNGFKSPLDFREILGINIFTHDAFTNTVLSSHGFSVNVEPAPLSL